MPEITSILTDDIGTITHLVTLEGERLTMDELAQRLDAGDDYYVTFGEEQRFSITMVAEDGRLEPTVDDTEGVHTIWDLPTEADPEEAEIENMFDEMNRMGEYDKEVDDPYVDDDDTNPESLL